MQTQATTETTQETGATRFQFWAASIRLAADRPMGSGFQGFDFFAPFYLPEDIDTGGTRHRSVHSTWFEALTEAGYLGMFALIMLVYSSFKALRKCMAKLRLDKDVAGFFRIVMLQSALLSYVISMTFMNRMRAEILYWMILYSACAFNIIIVKTRAEKPSLARQRRGHA